MQLYAGDVTGAVFPCGHWGRGGKPGTAAQAPAAVPRLARRAREGGAMQLRYGLLAELAAAPGEGDALAAFLALARETAAREEGTVTWYAFKLSDTTYGIFDTFASEDDRNAHL